MKYRLIKKGDLFAYQERLPNGDWWTATTPTTEEYARLQILHDIEREKKMGGFEVIEEFDSGL